MGGNKENKEKHTSSGRYHLVFSPCFAPSNTVVSALSNVTASAPALHLGPSESHWASFPTPSAFAKVC